MPDPAAPYLAFSLGRDQYTVGALAFRAYLDTDLSQFRLQYAAADSQLWVDILSIDSAGALTIGGGFGVLTAGAADSGGSGYRLLRVPN